MLSTPRARVRALAATGMAGVVAAIGAVSFQALAAEIPAAAPPAPAAAPPAAAGLPQAPAAFGPDARNVAIPGITAAIRPPAGSRPIGAYIVTNGTQNYTCAAAGTYPAASVPEAQLVGTGGRIHHFAGPSWQSARDSSLVTATKAAASDRSGTIPELLLKVATHTGKGILDKADYINRLYTSGGVAPAGACKPGQVTKVWLDSGTVAGRRDRPQRGAAGRGGQCWGWPG